MPWLGQTPKIGREPMILLNTSLRICKIISMWSYRSSSVLETDCSWLCEWIQLVLRMRLIDSSLSWVHFILCCLVFVLRLHWLVGYRRRCWRHNNTYQIIVTKKERGIHNEDNGDRISSSHSEFSLLSASTVFEYETSVTSLHSTSLNNLYFTEDSSHKS